MNVVQPLLTTAELAARADFPLGDAVVSPSARTVTGPGGGADVEPRVMQVLVVLADSAGQVVTRKTLFNRCWGGVCVGDDSLNRAVASVRKIAHDIARDSFMIETIPRTGYRLAIRQGFRRPADQGDPSSDAHPLLSRRGLVAGAGAAAIAVAGTGLWSLRSREGREFRALMDRAEEAFDYGDPADNPAAILGRAVAMRPDEATAQGLFAYAQALRSEELGGGGAALRAADRAADAALTLDPREPDARLARVFIERSTLDFTATEDRLRAILADAPDNIRVMRQLWNLLSSVGRIRDALAVVERAIATRPLAAANHYPRAQLLWILGRNAEADRIIDRAMHYWPSHRFVRFARFTIFALSDRPRAALAMLDSENTAPQQYTREQIALWRTSLTAIDDPSATRVAAARRANVEAAERNPALSNQAIMALSALGEIDAAFDVAEALFAVSRSAEPNEHSSRQPASSRAWRFTPWLFVPPTSVLRSDPRFKWICDEIGLTDYWTTRGLKPDYQLGLA